MFDGWSLLEHPARLSADGAACQRVLVLPSPQQKAVSIFCLNTCFGMEVCTAKHTKSGDEQFPQSTACSHQVSWPLGCPHPEGPHLHCQRTQTTSRVAAQAPEDLTSPLTTAQRVFYSRLSQAWSHGLNAPIGVEQCRNCPGKMFKVKRKKAFLYLDEKYLKRKKKRRCDDSPVVAEHRREGSAA